MKKNIWHRIWGFLAAGIALITCPCHLVLTLPLLLSVTAGTAVGAFLEKNYYTILAVSGIAFFCALILAVPWLRSGLSEDAPRSSGQPLTPMNRPAHNGLLQQDK
jgi:mercuric ion transport protein